MLTVVHTDPTPNMSTQIHKHEQSLHTYTQHTLMHTHYHININIYPHNTHIHTYISHMHIPMHAHTFIYT